MQIPVYLALYFERTQGENSTEILFWATPREVLFPTFTPPSSKNLISSNTEKQKQRQHRASLRCISHPGRSSLGAASAAASGPRAHTAASQEPQRRPAQTPCSASRTWTSSEIIRGRDSFGGSEGCGPWASLSAMAVSRPLHHLLGHAGSYRPGTP